jgi:hypothetical protein
MRFMFFALLCSAPAQAQTCTTDSPGPCVPKDLSNAKKPIMAAIRLGRSAFDEMTIAAIMKRHAADPNDDVTELREWTRARSAEKEMTDSYNLAITLDQQAYHLLPVMRTDPRAQKPADPRGAWCTDISAPWAPEFRISTYRAIMGSDNIPHYVSDDPKEIILPGMDPAGASGTTDPDGKVTIYPAIMDWSIFTDDPGPLAGAIYHELHHYNDLITAGWDDHEQMEIRAFGASLTTVNIFWPESTPDGRFHVRKKIRDALGKIIAANQKNVDDGTTHSPFPNAIQEDRYKKKVAEIAADETAYQDLAARVEKEKRDSENRATAALQNLRWQKFRIWSLYACLYIDGVHETDPEWGNPDRIRARDEFYRDYLRSNLVVMDKDEIDAGLKRDDLYKYGDIGRCQGQVVEMIRDLPGPVDDNWIMDKIEYDRNGGRAGEIISSIINSVHRAVVDGSAAIIETVTAPFTADIGSGGGNGGGNSGTGGGRAGGDGNTRMPNIDKLPWQQLRGISEHGW